MRRTRRAGWLALLLAAGLFSVAPPAAADPYHLLIDNAVVGTAEGVYDVRWVAQSFVPPTDFILTRVSLYVRDRGNSDTLFVTIRDCCNSGYPGSTTLASGNVDGPDAPGWLDVDMAPTLAVAGGQTYWIVAHSLENNAAQGYEWWNSNDNSAYGPGEAADSADGTSWSWTGKDYTFRVYGYADPSLTFSASVSPPTVGPGQSVTFRANFTNAGPGTSAALWVNVTLPPELLYTGDDAALIGGVRSGAYSFAFANVGPGAYAFNVSAQASGGVADGTAVLTRFEFEATDHAGAPLAPVSQDVPVTMRNARLSLLFTPSALNVDPGDQVVLNATVTNLGSESASAVLVEGTVDPDAVFVSSNGTYDSFARIVDWSVPSIAPTATWLFSWIVRIPPGTADLLTVASDARVAYEDLTGAPFPDETASRITTVHAPIFAPSLLVDRATVEAGQEVVATLDYDNTGSGTALRAWLNWSLGGHYALVSLAPALPSSPTASGFSIALMNVPPGGNAVAARLRVLRGLQDGLAMAVQASVTATDGNGNLLPSMPLGETVELLAPTFGVTLAVSNGTVRVGTLFDLNVVLENTGRAAANGWLNLTLPAAVTYVADNGTYAVTAAPGSLSWRIPLIPAGARIRLGVTLRGDAAATTSFRFVLTFTDAAGSPPATALSNAVAVEFVTGGGGNGGGGNGNGGGGGPPGGWLWWLGLFAVGLVVAALVVLIRKRVIIEEVFLVSHSGILLAHMSYALKHDRDRDLVSGMLTAVQDFIRDSFVPSLEGGLRSMDFGQRKILIRRGSASYLAIVLRGRTPSSLPKKMDETLRKFEAAFPQIADQVDGDMMDSAGEVLSRELLGR